MKMEISVPEPATNTPVTQLHVCTLVSPLSFCRTTTADRNFVGFDPNGRNVVDHGQKNDVKAGRRRVQLRPNWTNL